MGEYDHILPSVRKNINNIDGNYIYNCSANYIEALNMRKAFICTEEGTNN